MPKQFLLTIVFVLFLTGCAPKSTNTVSQPTATAANVKTSIDTQISTATPYPEIEVGVVNVNSLNVRKGPGTSYPTVGVLNKGEKFYVLQETTNSTNNKWLLISISDTSFGWIIGDQIYVTIQKETVDYSTYLIWQKNMETAKSQLLIPVTSP